MNYEEQYIKLKKATDLFVIFVVVWSFAVVALNTALDTDLLFLVFAVSLPYIVACIFPPILIRSKTMQPQSDSLLVTTVFVYTLYLLFMLLLVQLSYAHIVTFLFDIDAYFFWLRL